MKRTPLKEVIKGLKELRLNNIDELRDWVKMYCDVTEAEADEASSYTLAVWAGIAE